MGSKSKPTIGYWYRYLLHFGLSQVLDAILEMRGGEKTAWSGRAEGGTVSINARELWGGEKAEGGIEGELDVMLGLADQTPSARLASILGDQQTAYRNRASVAFEGLYGAFNPYPKAPSFKGVRILNGWQDDAPWYPEKAAILLVPVIAIGYEDGGVAYKVEAAGSTADYSSPDFDDSSWSIGQGAFGNAAYGDDAPAINTFIPYAEGESIWIRARVGFANSDVLVEVRHDSVATLWWNGVEVPLTFVFGDALNTAKSVATIPKGAIEEENVVVLKVLDTEPTAICAGLKLITSGEPLVGMNPAHMLYESITHAEMQGEPTDAIDSASFAAAADIFFDEGFGLCTKFNPVTESVEAFQKRILNVVGANLARSRVDGKYYLTAVRGVHDLESLPVLQDDDILEYEEEPSDPLESVNQVSVEWFDPVAKKKRTTTPLQSLGAIQSAGGIVAEVASYPEIPVESLALRVGARDLAQKTPLKRFRLTTNRVPYAWRAGEYFRLQAPRRGIADMVCMVGEIDAGTPRSGSMRLVAIQDVSGMPLTVYVDAEPGVDTSPSQVPGIPEAQILIEAPYVDLAGDLSAAELGAMAADAGYVLAVASRPSSGLNYTLFTAAAGETLTDRGSGDWCPTALVVEAATRNPGDTSFTLEDGLDLSLVTVGTAALWGSELVRVDEIDIGAMTVTLGRGCGDTPAQLHDAGERIWFYDTWASSDRREYAGGETVSAKLRTRTSSQLLDAALAPTLAIALDERAFRPYPPGALKITDELASDVVDPGSCVGELTVAWAHRDRLLQADQLLDASAGDIGPEAGTTYAVRFYLDDVLDSTQSGITGTSSTPYTVSGNGSVRVEVEAVRDGATSWLPTIAEFSYSTTPLQARITDADDTRITDSGDRRIVE
jgi:hypothetical protein